MNKPSGAAAATSTRSQSGFYIFCRHLWLGLSNQSLPRAEDRLKKRKLDSVQPGNQEGRRPNRVMVFIMRPRSPWKPSCRSTVILSRGTSGLWSRF